MGKVVYIRAGWLPTYQANGIQTVKMCEAFSKLGWEVSLYYIPSPFVSQNIFEYYGLSHRFVLRPLPRAVLPLRKSFTWDRGGLLKASQYFHAFLWSALVATIVRCEKASFYFTREPMVAWWLGRFEVPTVLEVHDLPHAYIDRVLLVRASCLRSVIFVIAITEHLRNDLVAIGVSDKKVIVLHDGVDLDCAEMVSEEVARQQLGVSLDKQVVVYTGQLSIEKGVDTLVRAASLVPEVLFFIVGGQEKDIQWLRSLATNSGAKNVFFIGHVAPKVSRFYQVASDLLVVPQSGKSAWSSRYTSPLKLFEYMASGRPIVATAVPCIMEVVEHGRTAWLVRPDDPHALAQGIRYVLENEELSKHLAHHALASVEKFSWVRRAESIIRKVGECNGSFR